MVNRHLNFTKNKQGQFMVLVALGIVIMMISVGSLLAHTSVSSLNLSKTEFREVTTQLSLNFRKALTLSLARVSKELDFKASVRLYSEFTTLEEYPEAVNKGYEFLSDWINTTLMRYSARGINLTISPPSFECAWDSPQGYSKASTNMTLDIINYGFYGWKDIADVELNLRILDLKENDGNVTSFYFSLQRENDIPPSGINKSLSTILFQEGSGLYIESESSTVDLTYFGGGNYLVTFFTNKTTIPDGLEVLKTCITNMSDSDFKNATYKTSLLSMVDDVIIKYNDSLLTEAYSQLSTDIRPKLEPENAESWVVEEADTVYILWLIDDILSQLVPRIKMFLQDSRGIIVGASATLLAQGNDTVGPKTSNLLANPNPSNGLSLITLTAMIDDVLYGWSNIVDAEYFIANGTGIQMTAGDGSFDSPTEKVQANVNVTTWVPGNYTIYVHGKDAFDNWGEFSSVTLEIIETPVMHVSSIDMSLETKGFWVWRRAVAVVTISDSGGKPVSDATVYGHWSGVVSGNVYGVTDTSGQFVFRSEWARGSGTFTFTVDNVILSGWIYDQSSNEETSDSITF